ncbi:sensor histidine kinase [Saccharicrinis aurantiacus]|uniref:sensor histidine kinase n=1 Tax=Saccharicrinis aurantiacus TaxID=1849719 RepID=UPI001115144A|nr:HAMP domain-containing sensor histidine kinase [Saccharicrinis aurantiacus]
MSNKQLNKHLVLGISTFIILLTLIVIQVLFMVKASKIEARNFNHRVVMALKESRDEIARAAKTCSNMNKYVCGHKCSSEVRSVNFQKVDSIISSNLSLHKINLDYTFELNNEDNKERNLNMTCYEQSLNGLLEQNGIKLLIQFPDSSKFVYAQMGTLFYISIASIILLMISFYVSYRMYSKEKSMLESTSFFIDNMIHEFHTPIANIKFASNLVKKKTEDAKLNKYVDLIKNEAERMECHIVDIQGITNIDPKNSQNFSFNNVLLDCTEGFKIPIKNKDGELILKLTDKADTIIGDVKLIKLVISNLMDNALKYNNNKPKIELSTISNHSELTFYIRDNGIGIPNKELNSIFEKYYRVPTGNIHDIKGFGIGLAFVKEVVEKHNGSISVTNNNCEGVTFKLTFKLANITNEN